MHDQPFGCISILFFGDFQQLGPVNAQSLPHSAIQMALRQDTDDSSQENSDTSNILSGAKSNSRKKKIAANFIRHKVRSKKDKNSKRISKFGLYAAGSSRWNGAYQFSQLTRYHLKQQQRARNDSEHMEVIGALSEGKQLTGTMLQLYKQLSTHDVQKDQSEWRFAPILVASNRERVDIAFEKAKQFAKFSQTYVIRWKNDCKDWQNKPFTLQERLEVQQSDCAFYQYFVPGADIFLTTNLNSNLGLANGTPATLHSITLETANDIQDVQRQIDSLPAGSIITLKSPPVAVNIQLGSGLDGKVNGSLRQQAQQKILSKLSISTEDIVIPLHVMRGKTKKHDYTIHQPTSGIGRITVQELFPFELAFAATIHKVSCLIGQHV